MTSPPSKILTRPRFHSPHSVNVSPALNVQGDPDVGFEITALVEVQT